MNDLKTIVLAAGAGFRLRPFTLLQPKCMLPIANQSVLARLLLQIRDSGIDEATIALPRLPGIDRSVGNATPRGLRAEIVHPGPLVDGSAQMARQAIGDWPSATLVIYGDSFLSVDFQALLDFHRSARKEGALATILYHRPGDLWMGERNGRTYHGVMSVSARGRVERFVEKPLVSSLAPGFDLANAAVFVLERELIDLPEFADARDFSRDVFEPAVRRRVPIYACGIGEGFRYDIGGIARWHELNLGVLRGDIPAATSGWDPAPGLRIGDGCRGPIEGLRGPCLIGKDVDWSQGAFLGPDTIIGDGCRLGEGCSISRCLVLDGCSIGAGAKLEDCLIGPRSVIGAGVGLPPHTVLGPYSVVAGDAWPNWAESAEYDNA